MEVRDEIVGLRFVKLMVFARPPLRTKLFARLGVFAGSATHELLEVQIVGLVVFAGPATDEILELQSVILLHASRTGGYRFTV